MYQLSTSIRVLGKLASASLFFSFLVFDLVADDSIIRTGPSILSTSPSQDATGVSIGQTYFSLTFDETTTTLTGEARLVNSATGEVIRTVEVSNNTTTGSTQSIWMYGDLMEPNTTYHIEIDAGAYQDSEGNAFEGINDNSVWSFTTEPARTEAPEVTSFNPSHESIDVSIAHRSFYLYFDTRTNTLTGEARIIKGSTGEVVSTTDVDNITRSNRTSQRIEFDDHGLLEAATEYYVEIDAGAFEDLYGNSSESIGGSGTWSFTTEIADSDAPELTYLSPDHESTEVSVLRNRFTLGFDERVIASTGEARIVKSSTSEVIKTVSFEDYPVDYDSYHYIYFDKSPLEAGTTYHIEVDANVHEDAFGNQFGGILDNSVWSFTTEETETDPPVISILRPANGVTNVDLTQNYFNIIFDEEVSVVGGEARLINSSTGEVVKTADLDQNGNVYWTSQNIYFSDELLSPSTDYHIEIDASSYEDVFGNSFEGISSSDTWAFTTTDPDSDPPVIETSNPEHEENGVSITINYIDFYFDEPVNVIDGEARLIETATGEVVRTAGLSQTSYTNSTYQYFTFQEDALLEPSTQYHIEIDAGSYEDLFGNAFEGIDNSHVLSFTTLDAETDPPVISSEYPENGTTGVSLTITNFEFNFDEPVNEIDGEVRLIKTATGEIVKTEDLSQNSYSNSTYQYFTFQNDDLLEPSTQYHVEIDAGSYEDLFGNAFEGISGSEQWSFTTEDIESDPPLVESSGPENLATDISLTRTYFSLRFDETVSPISGEVRLVKTSSDEIIKTADISINGRENSFWQNFYFNADLMEPGTQYHIEIDAGSYEDVFGNSFEGIASSDIWSFTTREAETDPPLVESYEPENLETGIALTRTYFSLYFDETVSPISGEARLIKTSSNEVIKTTDISNHGNENSNWQYFYFDSDLMEPATEYYIQVDAGSYEDVFGNAFEGITNSDIWSFTTREAETDPPVINSFEPDHQATGIALNASYFYFYFDEAVSTIGGEIRLLKTSTNEVVKTAYVSDFNNNNSTWQYFYFNDDLLEPSTQYHIEIDAGSYEDVFGNAFEGIADSDTWSFTTVDPETDPPLLESSYPENDEIEVSLSRNSIDLYFDEPVNVVGGEARLINTSTNEIVKTSDLSQYTNANSTYQYFYFEDNALLEPSTQYHIEIDAGSYEDLFGNTFEGVSGSDVLSFTTVDPETDPPVISYEYPSNGSTGIEVTRTYFDMNFDEPVSTLTGEARLIKAASDEVIKTADLSEFENSNSTYQYFRFDDGLLEASTEYYIEIDPGSYEDVFGNLFEGISGSETWSFTTQDPDADPPVISSVDPANDESDVDLNRTYFSIRFDESVNAIGGEARLLKTSTGEVIKTADVSDYINENSRWQYFYFNDDLLEASTQYHVEIDENSYEDIFGNGFEGIADSDTWSFTTKEADTDPPVIDSTSPEHESTEVSLTRTYFPMYFNEPVSTVGGEARLIETSTGEVLKSTNLSNYSVTNSTWQYFYFNSDLLEPSTQYHIEIDAGSYEDLFGNAFEGIDNSDVWSFTTVEPETNPPLITNQYPNHEGTGVSIGRTYFEIYFDEPVSTLTGEARLIEMATNEVIKTADLAQYVNTNSTYQYFYFNNDPLEASTEYYIEIDAGSYDDFFGNQFEGISGSDQWSFTTQDPETDPPTINYLYPNNEETGVSITQTYFQISFDETVSTSGGEARLVKSSTGETVKTSDFNVYPAINTQYHTFYFDSDPLEPSTTYHIEIDAEVYFDVFGNGFGGLLDDATWSFTTEDAETDPPIISSLSPVDDATGVTLTQRWYSIRFDERVSALTGEARLIKTSTGDVLATSEVSDYGNTNSSWQSLYFDIDLLEASTNYHIEVDPDTYEDYFGNTFAGITDETTWSFTSQDPDTDPPVITQQYPENASSGVLLSRRSFSLYFDEPVSVVRGEARLIHSGTGEIVSSTNLSDYNNPNSTYQYMFFSFHLLEASTSYHIEIDEGSYEDIFGNVFEGISGSDQWSFTTQDPETNPPVVTTLYPAHEETGVSIGRQYFEFYFDEPVSTLTGEARLVNTTTGEVVKSTDVSDYSNENSYYQYLFFDDSFLEPSTQYHIEIDANAYEDVFGNTFEGISDESIWSFTTQDAETDAPVITYLFPGHQSTEVSITQTYFNVQFDEIVIPVSGEVRLIETLTGEQVKSVDVNQNGSTGTSQNLYFNSELLMPSTQYHLEIDAGAYEDVFGNPFVGIGDETVWSFETEAARTEHPSIISLLPMNDATDVRIGLDNLYIQFDYPTSHNSGSVNLVNTDTDEVVQSWTPNNFNNQNSRYHYFYLYNTLEASTQYHVEIEPASFIDLFGNAFDGIENNTDWSFTTEDPETNAPQYLSFNPVNGASNVSIAVSDFHIQFDENVNTLEGEISLVKTSTGEVVSTIDVEDYRSNNWEYVSFRRDIELLETNTQYHFEVEDAIVEDLFGNTSSGFTGSDTWSFTTEASDEIAPEVTQFFPRDNTRSVGIGQEYFRLSFDEPVRVIGGTIQIIEMDTDEVFRSVELSTADYYDAWQTFIIPGDLFATETAYYINVDAGTFQDVFGNEFRGISDNTTWNFTTQAPETNAPEVWSTWPSNGEEGVSILQRYFYMDFDEPVKATGGNASLVEVTTEEVVSTITIDGFGYSNWQYLDFDDVTLQAETEYAILIDEGAYVDYFNNEFEGFSSGDWTFTTQTAETDAPVLSSIDPADESEDVGLGLNEVTLTFNENVRASGNGGVRLVETSTSSVIKENIDIYEYTSAYQSVWLGNRTLKAATEYHIEVDDGAFVDIFGNAFAGISEGEVTFTTVEADSEAPEVELFYPGTDESDIAIGQDYFYILFDEPVIPAEGNIRLIDASTEEVIEETNPYRFSQASEYQGFDFGDLVLSPSTTYYIEVDPGAYKDLFENDFEGITGSETWTFTTESTETDAPMIEFTEPANNSTGVLISRDNFYIYFDESVETGSGSVRIIKTETGEEVSSASGNDYRTGQYQGIFFEDLELEPSTDYHITIDEGAFSDLFGNDFAGISEEDKWVFRTEASETDAPVIESLRPDHQETEVSIDERWFQIEFDEAVSTGTGEIRLVKTSTDEILSETLPSVFESTYQSIYFSIGELEVETDYHIEIDAGTFVDAFGNEFEGISDETTWSFTTQSAETDPPTINYQFPVDGAEGIPLANSYFYLRFSEPVTGNGEYIRVVNTTTGDEFAAHQALDYGASDYYWFRLDNVTFEAGTDYHIVIDQGAFVDVFGNEFEGLSDDTSWNFTSESAETDAPEIEWLFPTDDSEGVSIGRRDFQISFNEKVVAGSGSARLIKTETSEEVKTVEISNTFTSEYQHIYFDETLLESNTDYHILIDAGAFVDVFENEFPGIDDESIWSFSTEEIETDAPEVSYLWPRNGAVGQSIGQRHFYIEFDEPVETGTGDVRLHKSETDEVVKTTQVNDFGVNRFQGFSFDDELLEANTSYYISISEDTYSDVFGNAFGGFTDSDTWSFTTESPDTRAPEITPLFPRNQQDVIPVDITFFQLSFDEVVTVGTGDINIIKTSTGDLIKTTSPSTDFGTSSYQGFVVSNEALESGVDYHIEMDEGTYVDAFGNNFEGISSSEVWSFTTENAGTLDLLNAAPVVSSVFPANEENGVALDIVAFNLTFNEAVSVNTGEIRLVKTLEGETIKTTSPNDFGTSRVQSFFFDDGVLEAGTQYHIEIDAGTYENEFNIEFEGIQDAMTWSFTTVDIEGPEVIGLSPENNETGIITSISEFEITFDEAVSFGEGSIRLINASTNEILDTTIPETNPSSANQVFTFDAPLESFVTYYIEIDEGTFEDVSGNAFGGIYGSSGWQFTTTDSEAPEINSLSPSNNTTGVDIDIDEFTISFDENVTGQELTINLIETATGENVKSTTSGTASGSTVTFTVSDDPLAFSTTYHIEVEVGAYLDDFGNSFAGISNSSIWSFTTEVDNTAPEVTSTVPENTATDVALDFDDFSITFNKTVTAGSGNINLIEASTGTSVATISPSGSGRTIDLSFGYSYSETTTYYIELERGAFVDEFGNESELSTGTSFWSFTSTTAPDEEEEDPVEEDPIEEDPVEEDPVEEDTPADQTIDFSEVDAKTYGDPAFELVATASSGLTVLLSSSDESIISISGNVATITGSGTVAITASQAGNNDFTSAASVTREVVISKSTLTVTPTALSTTYGESIPELSLSLSGFVNDEDESVLTTVPQASLVETSSEAGSYEIITSGGEADNYNFSYGSSLLTINPALAVISLSDLEQIADGTPKLPIVATVPEGLDYVIHFDGMEHSPSDVGEYAFTVVIDEQNYVGELSENLIIIAPETEEVLGISTHSSVQFFPNPVRNVLNLRTEHKEVSVELFTLSGSRLMQVDLKESQEQIDVSSLSKGVYLLQVSKQGSLIYESRLLKR